MTMRYVTTCHAKGFEQYGHRLLEGWRLMPDNSTLTWYTEDYDIPETPRVQTRDIGALDGLRTFKDRHSGYVAPHYRWDVVRFAHKVYACYDAMRNSSGLMAWIDADIIPYTEMPENYPESLLKAGDYIAMFRRRGMYSECGFWIVNCDHKAHHDFWDAFIDLYNSCGFADMQEWHDSYLMDVVVKHFEKEGRIKVTNLSAEHETSQHPMAKVDLAQYFDHCKGPRRKVDGVSPENSYRKRMKKAA